MRGKIITPALLILALASTASAQDDDLIAAKAQERKLIKLIDQVSEAFVVIGGGSGIIISPDGYILTNHHVAGSRPIGSSWTVIRPNLTFGQAKMVGTDPRGDISLLKLERPGPYPYVPLTDSDAVRVGEQCLALGNPFGFSKDGSPHVTLGIVSAIHRYQGGYSDAIQTDSAINPGNSGGPLIDMKGRLIGINGRIATRFGLRNNTGVGYAIPSNQISAFMPFFKKGQVVHHGTIKDVDVTDDPAGGACRVRRIDSDCSAYTAGLRSGDRIVEAGGRKVHNARRWLGIVGTYPVGSMMTVKVKRGSRVQTVELTLEPRSRFGLNRNAAYLGVHLSTAEAGGVEVESVVGGSPAETAGFQTGDVITKVDGKAVGNVTALINTLNTYLPDQKVKFVIMRNGSQRELEVKLGRRPKEQR